jgi:hypothetical protein
MILGFEYDLKSGKYYSGYYDFVQTDAVCLCISN